MMKLKKKYHFTKLFPFWGILFILGIAISITAVEIIISYRAFNYHSEQIRSNFIENQKQILQQEVMHVAELISHEKSQSIALAKETTKSRINEAVSIAQNIYQQNKGIKNNSEILKMVIDALRPIRFEDGSGYYFMIRFDGTKILYADKPEQEGKNLLDIQDSNGQHIVRDMITIAKQSGEGFYQHHCTKPGVEGDTFRKISFIKKIEPLNCFIGTGLYLNDVEETIKAKLLSTISRIRFGKEGYIFIHKFNGDMLVGQRKTYSGTEKFWEHFNQHPEKMKALFAKAYAAALTPDGEFLNYTFEKVSSPDIKSPKTSFIYGIPELKWFVGAGIHLDNVEKDIALMQAELAKQIKSKVLFFSLITLGILALFFLLFQKINLILRKDIDSFVTLSNKLISSGEPIDRRTFKSFELDQMAKQINTIFTDKMQVQQRLQHEETALLQSEKRATALLEAIPDMVFRMNGQGTYLDFKADPNNLYVLSRNDIIGKHSSDILPHDLAIIVERHIKSTIASGKMHTFEYQLHIPGQGTLDFEARIVKSGENEITSIIRDITKLKKALAETDTLGKQLNQAKRMESIGLMAGGVAHDLNNILSGIIGYPELILLTLAKDSDLRPQIEAIQQSGIRAAAVVDDLLTVARGAASTRAIQDINSLIIEYLNSPECSKIKSLYPHVTVKSKLKANHANIFCSQVHIKKCLMNLVTNGIEAIAGSGTVLVSTHDHIQTDTDNSKLDLKNGEYIVISIKDDGPGIIKEDLDHIFEPFYSKKIMERSGTGLGLTVVWNTVKDHDGKIFVDSSTQGTTFQLYFPVSHEKTDIQQADNAKDNFTGNGEHILVVDDEELLQNIACKMLEHFGYTVHTVSSGEAAIEYVKKHKVDLLVIDMLMEPGINGHQTYKEIIAINPGQKAIIASGFSENTDVKAAVKLGAGGFVKKPYSMKQLGQIVQKTLNTA